MARLLKATVLLLASFFCMFLFSRWHTARQSKRFSQNLSIDIPYFEKKPLKTILNFNTRDYKLFQNHSVAFMEEIQNKYGDIRVCDVTSVDTTLTLIEKKRVEICIKDEARDRKKSDSIFWGKNERIRTKHHDYLMKDGSVMIEVGGNKGDDATEFVRLFNPRYVIMEPLEHYYEILKKMFENNTRVMVLNLGLGSKNEIVMVTMEGNNACATSKFESTSGDSKTTTMVPLYLANTTVFFTKIGVGLFSVDLLTFNCEGCEFEALEALVSSNLMKYFRNIQFATHTTLSGIKDPIPRYCRLQELLLRTHHPTYQYKFIWESWRLIQ